MNFEADEDLAVFLDAITRLADPYRAWVATQERFGHAAPLEAELEAGGFYACAGEPSLGAVAAASMVFELARLPVCAEVAASALVGATVCPELPRPFALVEGDGRRAARFLPTARTVLRLEGDTVWATHPGAQDLRSEESIFAYPMGRLLRPEALAWRALPVGSAQSVRRLWRVALAAELAGCLQAGLDAVVAHVTERRQFGRPLGSFQGVQHRLAGAAGAILGARWLALRAAASGSDADAAMAAGHAQSIATRTAYDLHQFMGAMGLTLEHPLHRWSYRSKLLRAELGGAERQFQQVALQMASGLEVT